LRVQNKTLKLQIHKAKIQAVERFSILISSKQEIHIYPNVNYLMIIFPIIYGQRASAVLHSDIIEDKKSQFFNKHTVFFTHAKNNRN